MAAALAAALSVACGAEEPCFPIGEVVISGEGNYTPPADDKEPCFGNAFTGLDDFRAMSDGTALTPVAAGDDAITYPDECTFTVSRPVENVMIGGTSYSGRLYWLALSGGDGKWDGGGLLRLEDGAGNQCENRLGNVRITMSAVE